MNTKIVNLLKESITLLDLCDYECDYNYTMYKNRQQKCPCKHPEQANCKIRRAHKYKKTVEKLINKGEL